MHICHITSVHPRYDIRIFIKECKSLSSEHKVSLIVADSLGDEINDNITIYDTSKVAGGRLKRMYYSAKRIFARVLQLNPDVVHFHDPELINIGVKLVRLGYKVVYDVHEDVPKQILNKHWIPGFLRPLISKLVMHKEAKSSRIFAGIICATEIIANRFRQYNANTIAIHNYPILAELGMVESTWEEKSNHLCYLGSISETRGVLPLVNSLAVSNLILDLAGPFSNSEIENKVKSSTGYSNVNYLGILSRGDVKALLGKVKIGVVTLLPTPSYVESLPIKMFEYMLAGIPVLASDFELWRPIISGNDCGMLVNPEDSQQIAEACAKLLNDDTWARTLGENGRRAVLEKYNWEQEQLRLLAFYQIFN